MDNKKLMGTIEAIQVPQIYAMRAMEPATIWSATNGEWYRAISYGFRYGFFKGQRAAMAEIKKQKGSGNE